MIEDLTGADVVAMVASACAVAISYITLSMSRRLASVDRAMRMAEMLFAESVKAAILMKEVQAQLSAIRSSVNGEKTRIIISLLSISRLYLIGLNEIVRLNRSAGHNPTINTLTAIEETERSIADLEAQLKHQAAVEQRVEDREKAAKGVE